MFEDALFATNHRRSPQQRWAAALSFVLQASFVTVLVALPLYFTEALPLNLTMTNELPPVPHAANPPSDPGPRIRPQHATSEFVGNELVFIRVPTGKAKSFTDAVPPSPPCFGVCVEGATGPTGSYNPLDGILGGSAKGPVIQPPEPKAPKPVILSHIDEGLLIRKIAPTYPEIARITHQQGTVQLHAIIGRDGTIQQLQAISGPPLLIKAAMDAVRQWRYRPYVLNGQPVEVDTEITVKFILGG